MITASIAAILLVGSFLLLVILRVPIAFCLGVSSFLTVLYLGMPVEMVAQRVANGINSFSLLAVPFFMLAGQIMGDGGIAERLIALAKALVGWMRGGLAQVNVLDSTFFGGISGSSTADIAALGSILIPVMVKEGYDAEFSTNITVTSSIQALLIPPSHNMVIYAMVAGGVSVGQLFMAGLIPGMLLGAALMIYCFFISRIRNYPKGGPFSIIHVLRTSRDSILGLMTVLIIVAGVAFGVFTATESAAISVLWAFMVTFLVYREIPFSNFWSILGKALQTISMVLILLGMSSCFGFLLAYLQIPKLISNLMLAATTNPVAILLTMNVILLVFGMLMDMAATIMIATPILLPIAVSVGMSPVQFGVVLILNLGIGLITPPVGNALFLGSIISGVKVEHMVRALVPFYCVMLLVLLLVTFVPPVSMFIPLLMR
jgi:tripartite ATP-independent transporter DctM subunit